METYWNGMRCEARECRVIVADRGRFPHPWFADLVGQERAALEIKAGGEVFYLDNEDGSGLVKVSPANRGMPLRGHRHLDIERVVDAGEVDRILAPPDDHEGGCDEG